MLHAVSLFKLPGNTLPALYAYVVGAVLLLAVVASRGDLKALMTLSRRMALPLAIIGLIVSALWVTRAKPPPLGSVNGIYRNSCCEPVELKNGNLVTAHLKVPFKLSPMKYGLEGQGLAVEVRDGRIAPSAWPNCGTLLFADDRRSFTVASAPCGRGGHVTFERDL